MEILHTNLYVFGSYVWEKGKVSEQEKVVGIKVYEGFSLFLELVVFCLIVCFLIV